MTAGIADAGGRIVESRPGRDGSSRRLDAASFSFRLSVFGIPPGPCGYSTKSLGFIMLAQNRHFLPCFPHFCRKSTQVTYYEQLTTRRAGCQSRSIKPNQG
jgi:hypothetical protein